MQDILYHIWVFENQYFHHQHLSGVKNCALSALGSNLIQIRSSTSYATITFGANHGSLNAKFKKCS